MPLFLRTTVGYSVLCRDGGPVDSINSTTASTTLPATSTAVTAADDQDDSSCGVIYYARPSMLSVSSPGLLYVHKVVWFALGTFLPLLLIVYSNVRLIREIFGLRTTSSAAAVSLGGTSSSRSASKASAGLDKSSTITLTLTLIAIGVCFLVLVCPSMAVQLWRFANYSRYAGDVKLPPLTTSAGRAEGIAIVITNLTQAVKFSSNFLLYCVVSRSFRRTFGKLFGTRSCVRDGFPEERLLARPRRACNAALIESSPADENADTRV